MCQNFCPFISHRFLARSSTEDEMAPQSPKPRIAARDCGFGDLVNGIHKSQASPFQALCLESLRGHRVTVRGQSFSTAQCRQRRILSCFLLKHPWGFLMQDLAVISACTAMINLMHECGDKYHRDQKPQTRQVQSDQTGFAVFGACPARLGNLNHSKSQEARGAPKLGRANQIPHG